MCLPSIDSAGSILIGWREFFFKSIQVTPKRHSIHIILSNLNDNPLLSVSNVYGPNTKIGLESFGASASNFEPCLMSLGSWEDFNVTRFLGERSPREGDFSAMEEFDHFIINTNLIELPLTIGNLRGLNPGIPPPWHF